MLLRCPHRLSTRFLMSRGRIFSDHELLGHRTSKAAHCGHVSSSAPTNRKLELQIMDFREDMAGRLLLYWNQKPRLKLSTIHWKSKPLVRPHVVLSIHSVACRPQAKTNSANFGHCAQLRNEKDRSSTAHAFSYALCMISGPQWPFNDQSSRRACRAVSLTT